jgi:hypothetical protein
MRAVIRTCETCAAFNREHLRSHVVFKGETRIPPTAQCRRSAPPWPVVSGNDWCMAWSPRPAVVVATHPDDGA